MAVVRYLVDDLEAAVAFYTDQLGFVLERRMGPAFGILSHGDLALWSSGTQSSAARPMPDGRHPEPGGWNRLVLVVDDLAPRSRRWGKPASGSETRSCLDLAE